MGEWPVVQSGWAQPGTIIVRLSLDESAFARSLARVSASIADLGATASAATTKARDLEWRFDWYRDPGSAWWEA